MKIGILASESSWYYRDIARAALLQGHSCERLDFARMVARTPSAAAARITVPTESIAQLQRSLPQPGWPESTEQVRSSHPRSPVADQGAPVPTPNGEPMDVILVRTMPPGSLEQVVFRMDLLARLEANGTKVVNSPKSLECAVDKFLTTDRLHAAGLPVPDTIVCEHEEDAMSAFFALGEDVVVKPLFGSEGRGIVRVSDPDLAHRTFRTLMRLDSVLYLQRFINHGGFDVRILVLGNQVLGGMKRRSPGDFRTNVARAAIAEPHSPTPTEMEFALKAAAITGALIAGLDLLYDEAGRCYVIEVNAVPGWQAFGRVTGIDVAMNLIQALEKG